MNLEAVFVEPLLRALDDLIGKVVAEVGVNPAQTDLFQKQQQVVGRRTNVTTVAISALSGSCSFLGAATASVAAPPTSGSLSKSRRGFRISTC
jgi:hypothetical protein